MAVFLPVAYVYRTAPLYPRVALQAGSLAIVALGSVWFIGRAFALGLAG